MLYEHKNSFLVRQVRGGYDNNFLYIITCRKSGRTLLVDAPLKAAAFIDGLGSASGAVLVTHSHGDHIAHLREYRSIFPELQVVAGRSTLLKEKGSIKKIPDGQVFNSGELQVKIIETPGHYPDSVCFLIDDALFTGDTIFIGRTGRTVSPESNISDLYRSVYGKLLKLDRQVMVYPGHDYGPEPRMTMERNISISPLLQADSLENFIERMNAFENERHI